MSDEMKNKLKPVELFLPLSDKTRFFQLFAMLDESNQSYFSNFINFLVSGEKQTDSWVVWFDEPDSLESLSEELIELLDGNILEVLNYNDPALYEHDRHRWLCRKVNNDDVF